MRRLRGRLRRRDQRGCPDGLAVRRLARRPGRDLKRSSQRRGRWGWVVVSRHGSRRVAGPDGRGSEPGDVDRRPVGRPRRRQVPGIPRRCRLRRRRCRRWHPAGRGVGRRHDQRGKQDADRNDGAGAGAANSRSQSSSVQPCGVRPDRPGRADAPFARMVRRISRESRWNTARSRAPIGPGGGPPAPGPAGCRGTRERRMMTG